MTHLDYYPQWCKALSDPLRVRLVYLLSQVEQVCVCDLVATLGAPQSTVSRHLAILRNAHMVQAIRKGTWMHYQLESIMDPWQTQLIQSLVSFAETDTTLQQDLAKLQSLLPEKETTP